ncbi:MAG: hypothetical protein AAFZ15_20190 [Bacteroidota bacterium]
MKQNIDTYFKGKLFQREFEMKQDHWQNALELLEAADTKKRRGFFIWWTGGILSTIAIIAAFLFFNYNSTTDNKINIAQVEAVNNSDKTSDLAPASVPQGSFEKNETTTKTQPNKTKKPSDKNTKIIADKKEIKRNKIKNESIQHISNPSIKNVPSISTVLQKEINIKFENSKEELISKDKVKKSGNLFSLKKVSGLLIFVEGIFDKNLGRKMNPKSACFRPNPFHIGVTVSQLMQPFPKSGENLITGYSAGIIAQYDFNKNWFVNSSVQYMRRDGHFMASKMTETRNYRFGLELMENEMRPTSLHYTSASIMGGRQKGHHLFEGGFILDYLIGVRGEIGELKRTDPELNKKEFVVQEKGWIAENGFTKFNISPSLGYRYRVNKDLSLGFSIQYALRRLADEPEMGDYILKENNRMQVRAQAVYFLNK